MSNDNNNITNDTTTTTLSYARMLSTEGSDNVTSDVWNEGNTSSTTTTPQQIPVTVIRDDDVSGGQQQQQYNRREQYTEQPRRHNNRSREDKYSSERFHSWSDQHSKPLRLQDYCTFRHADDGIFHVQSDFGSYEWSQRDNAMVPFNGTFVQWCHFRNVLNKLDAGFEGDQWLSRINLMCGDDVLLQTPPPRWSRGGYRRNNNRRGRGGYRGGDRRYNNDGERRYNNDGERRHNNDYGREGVRGGRGDGNNYMTRLPPSAVAVPPVRIAVRTEEFPVLSSASSTS